MFCGSDKLATGFPVLCVGEYVEQCASLTSLINSLEMDVKQLVKDYEAKKKVQLLGVLIIEVIHVNSLKI